VPLQRTINVLNSVPSKAAPTAKHVVLFRHETPERLVLWRPGGIATSTTDHAAPFHCSISIVVPSLPS
jgi:hypothetical protein